MQVICISCHSYGYGKELAEKLSARLGYDHIAREELTDKATVYGIPVGKLETAILKRQLITEDLSVEIERFKAFITAAICERAKSNGIVYHGRMGHMVLQNLPNVLRIRAVSNEEERINRVMQRMNLTRKLAKNYIDQIDDDRWRYIRFFYNINCNDPSLYDIVVNSSHLSIEDSIDSLVRLTQLTEFKPTSQSNQKIDDLLLQAKCRLALGENERTRSAKVRISATKGNVSVVYLPAYEKQAQSFPGVLEKIEGLQSLDCTMAATNILYIQEKFNCEVESFKHLLEIAGKWNASVELVRLVHQAKENDNEFVEEITHSQITSREQNGGILDDTSEPEDREEGNHAMSEVFNKLIQAGRAGAVNTIYGGTKPLLTRLKGSKGNCLVVVGDVFLSSGSSAQKRMKRDLISLLSDQTRVPVIDSNDLKEQYLFGPKQLARTLVYVVLSALIYYMIFANQEVILKFFSATSTELKILATIIIFIFTPLAAFIISGFTHNLLKFVKLE